MLLSDGSFSSQPRHTGRHTDRKNESMCFRVTRDLGANLSPAFHSLLLPYPSEWKWWSAKRTGVSLNEENRCDTINQMSDTYYGCWLTSTDKTIVLHRRPPCGQWNAWTTFSGEKPTRVKQFHIIYFHIFSTQVVSGILKQQVDTNQSKLKWQLLPLTMYF